jgi:hypothetical protein
MSAPEPENLSPAELAQRELQEKERKAREEAEQAQLPYKWTQTIRDLDVTAPIPANIKGRDMQVTLTKTKIKVAIKGQDPIIEVRAVPLQLRATANLSRRAISLTRLSWTNHPGPSKPLPSPRARKSTFTSIRRTRWSGGRTS